MKNTISYFFKTKLHQSLTKFFESGKFWTLADLIFSNSQNEQTKFLALKMMERGIKVNFTPILFPFLIGIMGNYGVLSAKILFSMREEHFGYYAKNSEMESKLFKNPGEYFSGFGKK